jgi:hypothetical protein
MVERPVEKRENLSWRDFNQQRRSPWRVVPVMSDVPDCPALSRHELVELWTRTFGEPPPLVHDPPFMLRLIEAARYQRAKEQ